MAAPRGVDADYVRTLAADARRRRRNHRQIRRILRQAEHQRSQDPADIEAVDAPSEAEDLPRAETMVRETVMGVLPITGAIVIILAASSSFVRAGTSVISGHENKGSRAFVLMRGKEVPG